MESAYSNVSRPVLVRPHSDSSTREEFLSECRLLGSLSHDNVASLLGVVAEETPYCAVIQYSAQVRIEI